MLAQMTGKPVDLSTLEPSESDAPETSDASQMPSNPAGDDIAGESSPALDDSSSAGGQAAADSTDGGAAAASSDVGDPIAENLSSVADVSVDAERSDASWPDGDSLIAFEAPDDESGFGSADPPDAMSADATGGASDKPEDGQDAYRERDPQAWHEALLGPESPATDLYINDSGALAPGEAGGAAGEDSPGDSLTIDGAFSSESDPTHATDAQPTAQGVSLSINVQMSFPYRGKLKALVTLSARVSGCTF
jgi:hypothetical protein